MRKKITKIEQDYLDDAYDRWRDEQMALKEAEEELLLRKYDFLDLPVEEFKKYVDDMVNK